jgi:hypothetical protein
MVFLQTCLAMNGIPPDLPLYERRINKHAAAFVQALGSLDETIIPSMMGDEASAG